MSEQPGQDDGLPEEEEAEFHKIPHLKKRTFLAAFALTGNVRRAAQEAGLERSSHYKWLRSDHDYAVAFEQAREEAGDWLEEEARRRAVEGLKRFKFHAGAPIQDPETGEAYFEHEYSDTLLIFLLKGAKPEKYRERVEQQTRLSLASDPDDMPCPDWFRYKPPAEEPAAGEPPATATEPPIT